MKAIDSLIRLHRWHLDEKRRNLADLERMKEDFERQVLHLDAEIAAEQAIASEDVARLAYGPYAEAVVLRRTKLVQSIADLTAQVVTARDEVAEAFQEIKKFEILQEQRERRTREWQLRRDQAVQDEVAIQRHQRRQGAD